MLGVRTKAVTIAALLVLGAAAQGAADPSPIHPYRVQTGQRVRLWTRPSTAGSTAANAAVTAVDSTGLTVVIKDRTAAHRPSTDLPRMDVRRGWRYLRRAAVIGLVVGAVAGVLAEDGGAARTCGGAAVYGGVGAAVGAITAGAIWPAKWIPVDLESIRLPDGGSCGLPPTRRVRVSFTFSF